MYAGYETTTEFVEIIFSEFKESRTTTPVTLESLTIIFFTDSLVLMIPLFSEIKSPRTWHIESYPPPSGYANSLVPPLNGFARIIVRANSPNEI